MTAIFRHNKKRNVGLIGEFFSRYMASAIIEKKPANIDKARKIWDKYFIPGSVLQKEFQLFNILHEANLKNKNIAFSLVERVQKESKKLNQNELDKEKLALVCEINNVLKDPEFFERSVPDYKSFASVQLLMNAWRGTGFNGDMSDLAELEEQVVNHVLTEKANKEQQAQQLLGMNETEVDGLVLNIMQEKLNKKFFELFNKEQREIVNVYVFSKEKNSEEAKKNLSLMLENIKNTTLILVENEQGRLDAKLRMKLTEVKSMLNSPKFGDTAKLDDDLVGFYLSVAKLREELASKETK